MPIDDNLSELTDEQLRDHLESAIKRESDAQIAYSACGNLSDNPEGRMPGMSISALQVLDDELQSSQAEREAVESEVRRRRGRILPGSRRSWRIIRNPYIPAHAQIG